MFRGAAVSTGRCPVKIFERLGEMEPVGIPGCRRDRVNGVIRGDQLASGIFQPQIQKISTGSHAQFFFKLFIKKIPAHARFFAQKAVGERFASVLIDPIHRPADPRTHQRVFRFQKIAFRNRCQRVEKITLEQKKFPVFL